MARGTTIVALAVVCGLVILSCGLAQASTTERRGVSSWNDPEAPEANVTIPYPYASFVGKNGTGYVVVSGLASINASAGGGSVSFLFNSTIPGFVPSAVAVDPSTGTVYRLGNNLTNLCDNVAPNWVEIVEPSQGNSTVAFLALSGDIPAAHASVYQDAFYNPKDGLIYATVYNTAPNCSFGNLTSAVVTIQPSTGISKVLVSFETGLLVTASGKTAFNFNTLYAYVIVEDYVNADGAPTLYGVDLQGFKVTLIDCPDVAKIFQLSFNTVTNALIYVGNATDDSSLALGRVYVSETGDSATVNVTVPLKWLPEACQGINFRRGAFDPKTGYYAVACGGPKPEDFPAQVVTFNVHGGAHYAAVIRYPTIAGFFAALDGPLVYLPSSFSH